MLSTRDAAWFHSKTVVITGGTSGIGFEMAKCLVLAGSRVIICGRDQNRLEASVAVLKGLKSGDVIGMSADLAVDQQRQEMLAKILALGVVDILINNAGFGFMGDFASMPAAKMVEMREVNMTALAALSQAFLPGMQQRRSGGILNVGSVASFFPTPGSSFYGASKYFVRGLTEAMHAELAGYGVHVTGLYPGTTATGFLRRATDGKKDQWPNGMLAEDVAQAGLEGLRHNKVQVVPGRMNQLTVFVAKRMPVTWVLALVGKRLSVQIR
ncbi:MAG: SDR family NAD(P)-dependent oxidoreductase [Candidatus Omnitrophota bacterium]